MQRVKINTTQNVEIEYRVASIGTRILSTLLDYTILLILYIGLYLIFEYFQSFFKNIDESIMVILSFLIVLSFILYDFLCETFMNGQSIAKKITGIKVIKLDGSKPTVASYLLRWMLRIIDITLGYGSIGMITILINGKGQRIGDIAANTTVVNIRDKINLHDTIIMEIDENHSITFNEVDKLNDNDITTTKEVLEFSKKILTMNHQ